MPYGCNLEFVRAFYLEFEVKQFVRESGVQAVQQGKAVELGRAVQLDRAVQLGMRVQLCRAVQLGGPLGVQFGRRTGSCGGHWEGTAGSTAG